MESTDDTTFQILMDVRFDLPPGYYMKLMILLATVVVLDISSNEKDALDGKLQQLNRILEKEV